MKIRILILTLLIFGLIFRLEGWKKNINFAYDQARDATRIYEIAKQGNLKIVGPETDITGVFSGPFFYYLLTPIYLLSNFNPQSVSLFVLILHFFIGSFLIYKITEISFHEKKMSLLAMFLWCISYQMISFSKHISNASFLTIAIMFMMYGFSIFIFLKKKIGIFVAIIGFCLAVQFDFYLIFYFAFFPLLLIFFRSKIDRKTYIFSASLFLIGFSTFILAEIKMKLLGILSLLRYFVDQKSNLDLFSHFEKYISRMAELSQMSLGVFSKPVSMTILIVLMTVFLFKIRNSINKWFLFAWVFSTTPLFVFNSGVLNASEINLPILPGFLILTAVVVYDFFQKKYQNSKIIFLIFYTFFIMNFLNFRKDAFQGSELFAHQPINYFDAKRIVEYTYNKSQNKQFSICSVSVPLFSNTLWSFLYQIESENKQLDRPIWVGQHQTLNFSFLPEKKYPKAKMNFLIIEPYPGISREAVLSSIYLADQKTVLIEEKKIGGLIVQSRIMRNSDDLRRQNSKHLSKTEISFLRENFISKDARYDCYW